MAVTVKFFARLREELNLESLELDADRLRNAADTWVAATGRSELPENVFCAINQQHARPDSVVDDGDEVAFFPRITGGSS